MARVRTVAELQARTTLERASAEFDLMGLQWNNYEVDVELVASLVLRLGVQRVSLKVGQRQYAGVLDSVGGNIGVEKDDHPHRQRFSIAHEIGHFVLHISPDVELGTFCCSNRDMEIGRKAVLPPAIISSQHKRQEWEANVFAASLLMPENALVHMFRGVGGSIRRMAKQFNVSEQAMEIRLQHMDLPFSYRP